MDARWKSNFYIRDTFEVQRLSVEEKLKLHKSG